MNFDEYFPFSSKSGTSVSKPAADLFDQYFPKEPTYVPIPEGVPVPGADTPADFERGRKIAAENKSLLGGAKAFGRDIRDTYQRHFSENVSEGAQTALSGAEDVIANKPASAVGKGAFGLLGSVTAPLTAAYDTAGEMFGKVSGNPEAGSRAAALPIGAAPIKVGVAATKAALPTNRAMNLLVDSIGKENLPEVVKRLESNPRLTVMDVSNSVLQKSQKLATTPGEQQNLLEKFTNTQKNTAKQTVEDIYSHLGEPVNVKDKLDELKAAAKKVGDEQINPALANAKPVDPSGVIAHIDSKLKPGVQSVITAGEALPSNAVKSRLSEIRDFLTDNKSIRTDPKELHDFQSSLRAEASDLLSSSVGSERTLGREIMNVRQKLVGSIDEAAEGKYKPALSNFRDEKQVQEAFEKGADITSNRKGHNEDLPEFWQDWVNNAKEGDLQAAREGALTELRRQRATVRNGTTKAEEIPQIEYNKDKLSLLFGKEKTEKMAQELADERAIAVRNQKLYQGSDTAARMKADKDIALPEKHANPLGLIAPAILEAGSLASGHTPLIATALYGATRGAVAATHKINTVLAEKKNVELTKLMTATGEERQVMLQHFRNKITDNQSPKGNLVSKINALSRVIAP